MTKIRDDHEGAEARNGSQARKSQIYRVAFKGGDGVWRGNYVYERGIHCVNGGDRL